MKIHSILLAAFCSVSVLNAQKYDNYWVWGIYPAFQNQGWFGNGDMEFMDSLRLEPHWRNSAYNAAIISLSDANGNFLSHSNGFWVMDTNNVIIENGDSLNYGTAWEFWYSTAQSNVGYPLIQSMHFIPVPDNDSVYYIFHQLASDDGSISFVDSLCYSELLVNSDYSMKLAKKNVLLTDLNNLPQDGNLASCKHGNGRDWWVSYVGKNSNCVHLFFVTPDTIQYYGKQCGGDTMVDAVGRYAVFSLDGTKYACSGSGGINIFDFDRCNGNFNFIQNLPPALTYDSAFNQGINWMMSICFSPNNRFIYSCHTRKVLQYDLWDANPDFTRDTVGTLDYFIDTVPNAGSGIFLFCFSQTGPDGNIYIGPFNGNRFLCTIHNPDGKGDSCQFGMRDVVLPKFWRGSMPYYPNYRLGRLLNSACDTIYNAIKPIYTQTPWLKVYPNPASDMVRFDYNWVEWEKWTGVRCRVTDVSGRVVIDFEVPRYSSRQDVSVKQLAAGVYTVALQDGQRQIAVSKLTKAE